MKTVRAFASLAFALTVLAAFAFVLAQARPGTPTPTTATGGAPASTSVAMTAAAPAAVPGLPSLDDGSSPEPEQPGCLGHAVLIDRVPTTIELAATASSTLVVGTVDAEGPGRWSTADGKPPSESVVYPVYHLVRVHVDDTVGTAPVAVDGLTVVAVVGGSIGCDAYEVEGMPMVFKPGARYAFFLDAGRSEIARLAGVPEARFAWPIEDATVATPNEGKVDLQVLMDNTAAVMGAKR